MNNSEVNWKSWLPLTAVWLALFAVILSFAGLTFTVDDMSYLKAADAWRSSFPYLGDTHWGLRHTIVMPLSLSLNTLGPGGLFTLVLPALYTLLFFAVGWKAIRIYFGANTASIWALIFLGAPVVRVWAGLNYPDFLELLYVTLSLTALLGGARRTGASRLILLLSSGVAAALALLTRETAIWIVVLYAGMLATGRPIRRQDMLLVALGAAPIMLADTAYLWAMSGDPWYRFTVNTGHIRIPSDDLLGRTFDGRTLLNAELARRWIPDGPVNVHWAINPVIYLFLDMRYGMVWWLLLLLAVVDWRAKPRETGTQQRWITALGCTAALSFAVPTYVLMISQRPRYYLVALCCAALISAILLNRHWHRRRVRVAAIILLTIHGGIALFTFNDGRSRMPYILPHRVAAIISAAQLPTAVDSDMAEKLKWIMPEQDYRRLVLHPETANTQGQRFIIIEDKRKGRAPFIDPWATQKPCWREIQTIAIYKQGVASVMRALGVASVMRALNIRIASLETPQILIHLREASARPECKAKDRQ